MDAAQGPLVRDLIDRGQLPSLAELLSHGSWSQVKGPGLVGSGAVWPTFASATQPWEHGRYSEWYWDPAEMRIGRVVSRPIEPFWRALDRDSLSVGVIDIPFLQPAPLRQSFELLEWGSHERALGRTASSPPALAEAVLRDPGPHPIAMEPPPEPDGMGSQRLTRIAEDARRGMRMRADLAVRLLGEHHPDLLLVVFSELHHTGHLLWHTVEPDNWLYRGKRLPEIRPGLIELYRELDEQIGRVVEAAGAGARVVVFALHGMEAGYGIPSFLEDVLEQRDFGTRVDWRSGPMDQRARSAFGSLKRHAPAPARRLYNRLAPLSVNRAIAGPTLVAPWDWRRTRAFALNSDQHGWLRINLRGRERDGIVPESAYDETCTELVAALSDLEDEGGNRLTENVVRLDEHSGGPPRNLPDVVVHWAPVALADPVRVKDTTIVASPMARRLLGRHDLDGFCVSAGNTAAPAGDIQAAALHRLLLP